MTCDQIAVAETASLCMRPCSLALCCHFRVRRNRMLPSMHGRRSHKDDFGPLCCASADLQSSDAGLAVGGGSPHAHRAHSATQYTNKVPSLDRMQCRTPSLHGNCTVQPALWLSRPCHWGGARSMPKPTVVLMRFMQM